MKINQLLKLTSTLKSLSSQSLPLRASYSIAKFLSQTQPDLAFFNSRLSTFLTTYGAKDTEGNLQHSADNKGYVIEPTLINQCAQEMKDINNFEVDTPELKLYYSDLEKITISPDTLMDLMPYIEVET